MVGRSILLARPAISVEPYKVDIACARRDSLFQNPRSIIDHRIDQLPMKLYIADVAAHDSQPSAGIHDQSIEVEIDLDGLITRIDAYRRPSSDWPDRKCQAYS